MVKDPGWFCVKLPRFFIEPFGIFRVYGGMLDALSWVRLFSFFIHFLCWNSQGVTFPNNSYLGTLMTPWLLKKLCFWYFVNLLSNITCEMKRIKNIWWTANVKDVQLCCIMTIWSSLSNNYIYFFLTLWFYLYSRIVHSVWHYVLKYTLILRFFVVCKVLKIQHMQNKYIYILNVFWNSIKTGACPQIYSCHCRVFL